MTSKFNKNVLAAAIAAAAMVSGSAMAGELNYQGSKQITYAKDLFATTSRSIDLPPDFTAYANNALEGRLLTDSTKGVVAGNQIEVVVSLGDGDKAARFQSNHASMQEDTLKGLIYVGGQLNAPAHTGSATNGAVLLSTLQNVKITYSQGEREMRIAFDAPGFGNLGQPDPYQPNDDFLIKLPSLRLYDLKGALLEGSQVPVGLSVTNNSQQTTIFAEKSVFAASVWGEVVKFHVADSNKWIDVQRCENGLARTWFTPEEATDPKTTVGTSCRTSSAFGRSWFNAGRIELDITKARHGGFSPAGRSSRVANNDASGMNGTSHAPSHWGLISSKIIFTVKGSDLKPWNGTGGNAKMWLSISPSCAFANGQNFGPVMTVNDAGTEATYTHKMGVDYALDSELEKLSGAYVPAPGQPDKANIYVCFGANGKAKLVPQLLDAQVTFDHDNDLLYVNPRPFKGSLFPLRDNVGELLFQNVNPANNATAQSFLRLTNHNAEECAVTIDAKDDAGMHSAEDVKLTLKPHSSEQLNIDILESGVDPKGRITGKFGDGTGKWYVRVQPECARFDGSALNRNANDGTVTDLTPQVNANWLTPPTRLTK